MVRTLAPGYLEFVPSLIQGVTDNDTNRGGVELLLLMLVETGPGIATAVVLNVIVVDRRNGVGVQSPDIVVVGRSELKKFVS